MKATHDSLLLRVSCLRIHQTVFNKENSYHLVYIQACEKQSVNHVLLSLASPFYDLALHLCVLSTI